MELPKEHFHILHSKILSKANASTAQTVERIYGFGESGKSHKNSINARIKGDANVKEFLKLQKEVSGKTPPINGKYLYLRHQEASEEKREKIKLSGIYKYIYFKYLGYNDYNHFLTSVQLGKLHYVAHYYSSKLHQARSFSVTINFDSAPYATEVEGFHDSDKGSPVYKGVTELKRNNLHSNLISGSDHELKIILHAGLNENNTPQSRPVLFGLMLAVSLNTKIPIGIEVILVQNQFLPKWKLFIHRYLMLTRNCISGNSEEYGQPNNIRAIGQSLLKIEHMVGTWRIWAYLRGRKEISQSKFVISEDYSACLFTPPIVHTGHSIFTCLLNTHSAINAVLFVSATPKDSINLMYYTIIDIHRKSEKFSEGVYSSAGVENDPSKGSYIALYKDTSMFEPEILTIEAVNALAKEHEDLKQLRKTLFQHEKVENQS